MALLCHDCQVLVCGRTDSPSDRKPQGLRNVRLTEPGSLERSGMRAVETLRQIFLPWRSRKNKVSVEIPSGTAPGYVPLGQKYVVPRRGTFHLDDVPPEVSQALSRDWDAAEAKQFVNEKFGSKVVKV